MVEKSKKFHFQDNEKFCIFVTKDKRQAIILTLSCIIEYLQVLTARLVWNFLFLIVIFNYFEDDKGHRFDDTME